MYIQQSYGGETTHRKQQQLGRQQYRFTWSRCLTMPRFFLSARWSTGMRSPCAICCVDACTWSLRSGARRPSARDSNDPSDLVIVITWRGRGQQTSQTCMHVIKCCVPARICVVSIKVVVTCDVLSLPSMASKVGILPRVQNRIACSGALANQAKQGADSTYYILAIPRFK